MSANGSGAAGWREEFFASKDGTRLFRCALEPAAPKGVVAIVHGYADHCLRYRPVMEHLVGAGFGAHAFDYRGHGQAAGRRGFVARFDDYLDDLEAFLAKVRGEAAGLPLFLVAHSHGALVSSTLLAGGRAPADLAGFAVSAPYFRLRIEPSRLQLFQANVVGRVLPWLPIKNPLTEAQLTRDEAFQKETARDPLRHHVVTPRWFTESTAAQERLRSAWGRIALPLLVMQGEDDPVVVPSEAKRFHDDAASADKMFVPWPGMRHEIFNELGKEEVLGALSKWLDDRVSSAGVAA